MRIHYSARHSRICTKLLAFFDKTVHEQKSHTPIKLTALILVAGTLFLCANNI